MILTVTLNAAIDKRYVVEAYRAGEVNRVKECAYTAGGKGLNVSKIAKIAGEEVLATGFLGGHAGHYIEEYLKERGIQTDFVYVDGESRSCINIYDESSGRQTEFLEPGVQITKEQEDAFIRKYRQLVQLEACSIVEISGSVPKGTSTGIYRTLIQIAEETEKKVIVDTSGALLTDVISAEQKPFLIKPNMDEIRAYTGKSLETEEELAEEAIRLQKSGIGVVVISRGKKGSLIASESGLWKAAVPPVETVNSVGCGDSMIAGYAAGFSRGLPFSEIIRLASAISAANAMRKETGFFLAEDMERLLPLIEVSKIETSKIETSEIERSGTEQGRQKE